VSCRAERAFDEGPQPNWDHPIGGEAVSLRKARQSVIFDVVVPRSLGDPKSIFATSPTEAATLPQDRAVAFVYDTSRYGRVNVVEHIPQVPLDRYDTQNQEVVELAASPDVGGSAEIVVIRRSKKALATTAEDESRSSIFWLEGNIEIVVRGPSLTKEQCIQIAEAL
jgi:hypothetical protein